MHKVVTVDEDQHRLLVAIRYLNASEAIWKGLNRQQGANDFHFLVTLRSFIEYSRRGIWFLAWADRESVKEAEKVTFKRPPKKKNQSGGKQPESPKLEDMDAMINEALGQGKKSPLMHNVKGVNEPFLDCLHALTHGNPMAVRMMDTGLEKIFDFNTEKLLAKAELDLGIFRILLYRRMLGEELDSLWKLLSTIHNQPATIAANVRIAALAHMKAGKAATLLGNLPI